MLAGLQGESCHTFARTYILSGRDALDAKLQPLPHPFSFRYGSACPFRVKDNP
jgi:hypothetical protein